MANERTVDWHPSLSQLTSRMHPLMFLSTHKGFISPEYFFNFFLKLYIPPWLWKILKFMVKITGKSICESQNWICSFLLMPAKLFRKFLSLPPRQKDIFHSFRTVFSEDIFFPSKRGWGQKAMELGKIPKLNLRGYWSQVLINSTIFSFCFAVPQFSFKHAEVWRYFNFTNKSFTQKCSVQEWLHEIYNFALPYFLAISPTIC